MFPHPTKRFMVEVGHKCNVKCIHCYHANEKNTSFLTFETIKHEIDKWARKGNNYCEFSGGEPTIHPEMPKILDYCYSIGLKTSIITNGIAGSGATENIIKAGIDDFLISVHGTEKTVDLIMQLQGARKRQERFMTQLRSSGKSFRFNYCMVRANQDDIVNTAKWALQWKPYIFNFINMNPHHEWQKDIEATKKVIADLNKVEEQLSEAIPIILDAGIGVNVRYFPMCRLPEPFRMHVCNDLQVMFDPFEWANYCEGDKNYKNYYAAGINMSRSIEWKGQPCQQCDIRFICGGINSAFFRACDMNQSLLTPIKDSNIVRDDIYHYRRNNVQCLKDPVKSTDGKLNCIIIDEKNFALVPILIENTINNNPDGELMIFTHYSGHDELRKVVDRFIGYGIYDHFVKKVSMLEMQCDDIFSEEFKELIIEHYQLKEEFSDIKFFDTGNIVITKITDVVIACSKYSKVIDDAVTTLRSSKVRSSHKQEGKRISTKVMKFDERHHEGELLIMTACNEKYQWYIPLFLRSMQISYPNQKTEISIMGELNSEIKQICNNNKFNVELREFPPIDGESKIACGNYETAAMRFLIGPHSGDYDYYLITDIDILFQPHQQKNIIDQHMMHLLRDGTQCYENLITEWRGDNPRMPGIHFVTKEWWNRTEKARENEKEVLLKNGTCDYTYDEFMIGRIVLSSGLPITQDKLKMQWKHGIHLGDWRINMHRKHQVRPDTFAKMHIRTLLDDKIFMELVEKSSKHIDNLGKIIKGWPILFK